MIKYVPVLLDDEGVWPPVDAAALRVWLPGVDLLLLLLRTPISTLSTDN